MLSGWNFRSGTAETAPSGRADTTLPPPPMATQGQGRPISLRARSGLWARGAGSCRDKVQSAFSLGPGGPHRPVRKPGGCQLGGQRVALHSWDTERGGPAAGGDSGLVRRGCELQPVTWPGPGPQAWAPAFVKQLGRVLPERARVQARPRQANMRSRGSSIQKRELWGRRGTGGQQTRGQGC